eukprot:TRINITY_DN48835_c0_g1_i1.p1 TRINITY_DN48835_c0_g1~~TRINITY_DN48835_c0_g1_i1.p1  ORF type:complete len:173 (-),score=23.21 TRINITY_DN48835_c0_g1_i1:67-528(-)
MNVKVAFPDSYALCFVPLFLSWIMNFFLTLQVLRARSKYGIQFPALYAPPGHKHEIEFNCVQRAHQNTLESWSMVMITMLVTGLVYPVASAVAGTFWVLGRFVYGIGYALGNPNYRMPGGILSHLGDMPLLAMAGMIAWDVVKNVAVKGKLEL